MFCPSGEIEPSVVVALITTFPSESSLFVIIAFAEKLESVLLYLA